MNIKEKIFEINEIFSPSAPIENINLFSGREKQVDYIKNAFNEKGQHVVMYGKRGAGKTSLSNILNQVFEDVFVVKITCNRSDNFISLWRKAVRKIKYLEPIKAIGFKIEDKAELVSLSLPENEYIDSSIIEDLFIETESPILLIFDEFDTISDPETKILFADTLKSFSDNVPNVTILIVGIGQNISDLIGTHPSLERCIKQVHLPLMTADEIKILIDESLKMLGLKISKNIINKIIEYSSGFPHYIHLLCKYACIKSVEKKLDTIDIQHFDYAVEQSIENSDYSLKTAYNLAVKSSKVKNKFEDIIFACAEVLPDNYDAYSITTVVSKYNELNKTNYKEEAIRYNIGMLCRPERGNILEKAGTARKKKYRFKNPLMKVFVKLKLHKSNFPHNF